MPKTARLPANRIEDDREEIKENGHRRFEVTITVIGDIDETTVRDFDQIITNRLSNRCDELKFDLTHLIGLPQKMIDVIKKHIPTINKKGISLLIVSATSRQVNQILRKSGLWEYVEASRNHKQDCDFDTI